MYPELSIIIVNWNTKELLRGCLESIAAAERNLTLEIIVVDNGSTDGSVEMCQKIFPETILIKNCKNLGFGQANNQGIFAAKSELILLLNSDTIVFSDSLEEMVKLMHKDPSIGVLGCRLIRPDGSYQPSCLNFPTLKTVIVERLLLYKLSSKLPGLEIEPPYISEQTQCDWVLGACMLIRRKAIETAGLFDSDIFMYGEEMELCYRIKKAGWKIIFNPKDRIVHIGGGSWSEKSYSPTFLKNMGTLYFFKKHYSIWTYYVVRFLYTVGAILRLLIWSLLYLYKSGERARVFLEITSNLKFVIEGR